MAINHKDNCALDKANHSKGKLCYAIGRLHEDFQRIFEIDQQENFENSHYQHAKAVNKGYGRIEIRQRLSIRDKEYLKPIRELKRWPGLKTLVMIENERRIGTRVERQVQYYQP